MYESNPWNDNLYDLYFDGGERFINIWQIYCINDDIMEIPNNGSNVGVYINRM